MFYLISADAMPSFRYEPRELAPDAIITAEDLSLVTTRGGNLAIHRPTGVWVYLSDAELAIVRTLDGRPVCEAVAPPGWTPGDVATLVQHLWQRGLVSADGTRLVTPARIACEIEQGQDCFFLVLLLSGGCNLACTYCYWPHAIPTSDLQIDRGVALEAIARAMARREQRVSIDFGEIACAERLFRDLVDRASEAGHSAGKRLDLAIQTNGTTLEQDLVEFLRDRRVFVNLSMDGPELLNDRARVFHGGRGAYQKTAAGLRRLIEARVPHQVKVTVARHNVGEPEAVIGHLLDLGVEDYMFKPVITRGEARSNWDGVGIEPSEYARFLQRAHALIAERSPRWLDQTFRNFLWRALGEPEGWQVGCTSRSCVCGDKMVVVQHDGGLSACPRFVGLPADGAPPIPIRRRKDLGVTVSGALRSPSRECSACPWLRLCGGGCTLAAQQGLSDREPLLDPDCGAHLARFEILFGEVLPRIVEDGRLPDRIQSAQLLRWEQGRDVPGSSA